MSKLLGEIVNFKLTMSIFILTWLTVIDLNAQKFEIDSFKLIHKGIWVNNILHNQDYIFTTDTDSDKIYQYDYNGNFIFSKDFSFSYNGKDYRSSISYNNFVFKNRNIYFIGMGRLFLNFENNELKFIKKIPDNNKQITSSKFVILGNSVFLTQKSLARFGKKEYSKFFKKIDYQKQILKYNFINNKIVSEIVTSNKSNRVFPSNHFGANYIQTDDINLFFSNSSDFHISVIDTNGVLLKKIGKKGRYDTVEVKISPINPKDYEINYWNFYIESYNYNNFILTPNKQFLFRLYDIVENNEHKWTPKEYEDIYNDKVKKVKVKGGCPIPFEKQFLQKERYNNKKTYVQVYNLENNELVYDEFLINKIIYPLKFENGYLYCMSGYDSALPGFMIYKFKIEK
jgi:hypothetical protein